MKMTKKKLYLAIALTALIAISVPVGAYAMLHASTDSKTNEFDGGYVNSAVIEKDKIHEDSSNNEEVYKELRNTGDEVAKVVQIKNIATGKNAVAMYARVRLLPSIVKDDDNSVLAGEIRLSYEFEKNTAWKVKDGVFYYTEAIEPGSTSEVLLKKVRISQDIPQGYHLELKVVSDCVAINPYSNLKNAWELTNGFNDLLELDTNLSI